MKIKLSKSANKFLKKLDSSTQKTVVEKIGILKTCLETQKIYPPEELDIKSLKANSRASLGFVWARFVLFPKFVRKQTKF